MKNNIYLFPQQQLHPSVQKYLATITACKQGIALQAKTKHQYITINKQAAHLRALKPGDEVLIECIDSCNIITALLLPANAVPSPHFTEETQGIWSLQIGKATLRIAAIGSIEILTPKASIKLDSKGVCLLNADIQEIKGRMIKLN